MEWSTSLLRHFKIQTLLKINCMAAISAFGVAQHSQICSLFFRNRTQCIAFYQLYNFQALFNLRRGYYTLRYLVLLTVTNEDKQKQHSQQSAQIRCHICRNPTLAKIRVLRDNNLLSSTNECILKDKPTWQAVGLPLHLLFLVQNLTSLVFIVSGFLDVQVYNNQDTKWISKYTSFCSSDRLTDNIQFWASRLSTSNKA